MYTYKELARVYTTKWFWIDLVSSLEGCVRLIRVRVTLAHLLQTLAAVSAHCRSRMRHGPYGPSRGVVPLLLSSTRPPALPRGIKSTDSSPCRLSLRPTPLLSIQIGSSCDVLRA
jgi:hypothetical protein